MTPKINKEKCIGCGTCEALCPAVFKLNNEGKSELLPDVDVLKHRRCIQEALESCPTKAIELEKP